MPRIHDASRRRGSAGNSFVKREQFYWPGLSSYEGGEDSGSKIKSNNNNNINCEEENQAPRDQQLQQLPREEKDVTAARGKSKTPLKGSRRRKKGGTNKEKRSPLRITTAGVSKSSVDPGGSENTGKPKDEQLQHEQQPQQQQHEQRKQQSPGNVIPIAGTSKPLVTPSSNNHTAEAATTENSATCFPSIGVVIAEKENNTMMSSSHGITSEFCLEANSSPTATETTLASATMAVVAIEKKKLGPSPAKTATDSSEFDFLSSSDNDNVSGVGKKCAKKCIQHPPQPQTMAHQTPPQATDSERNDTSSELLQLRKRLEALETENSSLRRKMAEQEKQKSIPILSTPSSCSSSPTPAVTNIDSDSKRSSRLHQNNARHASGEGPKDAPSPNFANPATEQKLASSVVEELEVIEPDDADSPLSWMRQIELVSTAVDDATMDSSNGGCSNRKENGEEQDELSIIKNERDRLKMELEQLRNMQKKGRNELQNDPLVLENSQKQKSSDVVSTPSTKTSFYSCVSSVTQEETLESDKRQLDIQDQDKYKDKEKKNDKERDHSGDHDLDHSRYHDKEDSAMSAISRECPKENAAEQLAMRTEQELPCDSNVEIAIGDKNLNKLSIWFEKVRRRYFGQEDKERTEEVEEQEEIVQIIHSIQDEQNTLRKQVVSLRKTCESKDKKIESLMKLQEKKSVMETESDEQITTKKTNTIRDDKNALSGQENSIRTSKDDVKHIESTNIEGVTQVPVATTGNPELPSTAKIQREHDETPELMLDEKRNASNLNPESIPSCHKTRSLEDAKQVLEFSEKKVPELQLKVKDFQIKLQGVQLQLVQSMQIQTEIRQQKESTQQLEETLKLEQDGSTHDRGSDSDSNIVSLSQEKLPEMQNKLQQYQLQLKSLQSRLEESTKLRMDIIKERDQLLREEQDKEEKHNRQQKLNKDNDGIANDTKESQLDSANNVDLGNSDDTVIGEASLFLETQMPLPEETAGIAAAAATTAAKPTLDSSEVKTKNDTTTGDTTNSRDTQMLLKESAVGLESSSTAQVRTETNADTISTNGRSKRKDGKKSKSHRSTESSPRSGTPVSRHRSCKDNSAASMGENSGIGYFHPHPDTANTRRTVTTRRKRLLEVIPTYDLLRYNAPAKRSRKSKRAKITITGQTP